MATVRDVVERALRLLGVAPPEAPPTGEEASRALAALNAMLAGWEARGVDLDHADYTLNDTFETATLTAKYRDHVTALLAVALAPEFVVPIGPALAAASEAGWRAIQANFLTSNDLAIDTGLQRMPSQYWGWGRFR